MALSVPATENNPFGTSNLYMPGMFVLSTAIKPPDEYAIVADANVTNVIFVRAPRSTQ